MALAIMIIFVPLEEKALTEMVSAFLSTMSSD